MMHPVQLQPLRVDKPLQLLRSLSVSHQLTARSSEEGGTGKIFNLLYTVASLPTDVIVSPSSKEHCGVPQ